MMVAFFMILSLFASFCLGYFACLILTMAKVSDLESELQHKQQNKCDYKLSLRNIPQIKNSFVRLRFEHLKFTKSVHTIELFLEGDDAGIQIAKVIPSCLYCKTTKF